ncbi:MAG: hypothetical protein JWN08_2994 [Frankiales bacterium]|jgi:hypothetical protein|nr:hypothetical protein [Frankiales bacterium]
MDAQTGLDRGAVGVVPRPPAPRRKAEPRPVPVRDDSYLHLSIDALRAYRKLLTDEENKVSYWRRILQARLDVVRAGPGGRELDTARLRPVLTQVRVGAGRQALCEVMPVDDIPPLPHLAELWERRVESNDPVGQAALEADLHAAEDELSAYRSALHRRIGEATGELIARYREQPDLCLSALPLGPRRATG